MCHPHVTARASDSDTLTDILCAIQILSIEIRVSFLHFTRKYRVRQKNGPLIFSPFSQQPFGILIRNFTALFTDTYI